MWNRLRIVVQGVYGGIGFGLVAATAIEVDHTNDNNRQSLQHLQLPITSTDIRFRAGYREQRCNTLEAAIDKSKELITLYKEETGAPGIVVGVSIDGKTVWEEGTGYSDLENRVPCSPDTVMRIASISKSITMTAVAKIWEEGKLDLDKPVQDYVRNFPEKIHDGEKVTITMRHLVTHLSGIRHYTKKDENNSDGNKKPENNTHNVKSNQGEFKAEEYYIKEHFSTIENSLNLFKDDPLAFKPGTSHLYTTHGWTLVSAVVEAVVKTPFQEYITKLIRELGMHHTYLDIHEKLIKNRARFYRKTPKGHIENAPYVDNSYKWAGGGILSTVGDLMHFGNLMLYSYQYRHHPSKQNDALSGTVELLPGFLKHETVEKMWTPIYMAKYKNAFYGMGWAIVPSKRVYGFCDEQRHMVAHSGAAVGGSSILLIMPRMEETGSQSSPPPRGVTVAILTNLQEVDLYSIAVEVAKNFDEISKE